MKEQMIKEELGKLGILIDNDFTARVIEVYKVYYTNDIERIEGYFETLEDAIKLMELLPGYTESRVVLALRVNDQFILLSKMKQIEVCPAGHGPYLSPEEQKVKSQEKFGYLIKEMEKKMSLKNDPKLTQEELNFLFDSIGQSSE